MSENPTITSFVIRCSLVERNENMKNKQWRIKITHVQNDEEISVHDLNEAFAYIKDKLGG